MLETYPQENMNTQAIRELTDKLWALEKKVNDMGGGGGGGADVPTPTVADAGKVLGVDEQGEYALVEGGGSGGIIVNFIYDTEEPPNIVAIDKTYNEITSVLNAGGCVRAKNVTEQSQEGSTMTSVDYLDIVSCAIMTFDDPSLDTQYGIFIDLKNGLQPLVFMADSPDTPLEIVK